MKEKNWLTDLLTLVYPCTCSACGRRLQQQEDTLCLFCLYELPKTNFHTFQTHNLAKKFWGRVPLEQVASFYFFTKGGKIQQLLHKFKYENQPQIGFRIGQLYGIELAKHPNFQQLDAIIPIPLHPRKLAIRGYNQSQFFAEGLAESLKIPCWTEVVIRSIFTESQTRKDSLERWKNVSNIFKVIKPEKIKQKHLLLVDDVITTGSTIEACAKVLLEIEGVKSSVVSMATSQY